jgi:hypothetical protein
VGELFIRSFSQVFFQAIFDFTPGQHYPVFTGRALQADIRPKAGDFPGCPSAWMGFLKPQNIVHIQIGEHGKIISYVENLLF